MSAVKITILVDGNHHSDAPWEFVPRIGDRVRVVTDMGIRYLLVSGVEWHVPGSDMGWVAQHCVLSLDSKI